MVIGALQEEGGDRTYVLLDRVLDAVQVLLQRLQLLGSLGRRICLLCAVEATTLSSDHQQERSLAIDDAPSPS
jgi:hypothetical protein